jgi:hypothetical protein
MADTEPTDLNHPHPGQRVNIEELTSRKFSDASNWSTNSTTKRPSTASSTGSAACPGERTWKDFTTSETFSQKGEGVQVRDFADAKKGGGKTKSEVEKSRRMLEKSSLM